MNKKPKLDKHINKDVILCETTNRVASYHTTDILLEHSISFSKIWKKVPFYKRNTYNGADHVCVISINRNEYGKARRAIDNLERKDYKSLMLNVI